MISLYNFESPREFIRARFEAMPKRGYGQSLRLAEFLGVHTTLVSQVLKGGKTFTLEQGALVADFFGLTEDETDYLLLLLQIERAGTPVLRKNLERQKEKLRARAKELVNRLNADTNLSEEKKAVFYSDWIYSAVRQLVALPGFAQPERVAAYFQLSPRRIREVVDFLLSSGLLVETPQGLVVGTRSTHLESSSPWVHVHHANWRQKAITGLSREDAAKLHYTCPMTLSASDALKVREQIVKLLESVDKVIEPSPSEELRCLNIDWFKV